MSKVTIWQCRDYCCEMKPHERRVWMARSRDFLFYEQVRTFDRALKLTTDYIRSAK